ncbi:MAG TPA: class I SAM-dependent methyltransferase [Streptosporangiaceae bacterium]
MTTPSENPDRDQRARRASSFGAQAAAYAEHRPDYPDEAVRWALEPVCGRPEIRVADLGAGTGKLTAALLRQDRVSVVAIEPDPAMLAELRTSLPGVTAMPGRAEEIPLPDGSVDAVICGQAAHWFDMDKALPEIARVLTPGGVLAGLWNMDDNRVPWVVGLAGICPSTMTLEHWTEERGWPGAVDGSALYLPASRAEFPNGQRRTADSLVAAIGTHSRQLIMPPADRDELLGRVRDYLLAQPETAHGEFTMPMVTGVLRAMKR